MSDMDNRAKDSQSETILETLMATIKKLSESEQEYLLYVIQDWIKDKRKYPRVDYSADVVYSDDARLAQGFIVNISPGGLYIEPDSPFTVGKRLTLTFEHPKDQTQIKVAGEIVRSDQKGIGVRFYETIKNIF
ncbi:MAG: PilZ domain-containing protein [Deltaproteobacteria bacterium]|nr:PilZ domain-containing protein [Deltaproteobacteria bacterium]